ncbi:hypothetical protein PR048_026032 [Dryococelus australis]|uniref:Prolactin receptor n=1 Tax=Dryococelus australis TaxID=614101 RepID=A0ABQ9GK75_9NEOP|nr:hypothetical protein PR048_026032 [Dryococelus australis]
MEKPKSGWPDRESNTGPHECEYSELPLHHLAQIRRGGTPVKTTPTSGIVEARSPRAKYPGGYPSRGSTPVILVDEFRAIEDEQREKATSDQRKGSLRLQVSSSGVCGWQAGLLN